jgi:hypothetical protein
VTTTGAIRKISTGAERKISPIWFTPKESTIFTAPHLITYADTPILDGSVAYGQFYGENGPSPQAWRPKEVGAIAISVVTQHRVTATGAIRKTSIGDERGVSARTFTPKETTIWSD